MKRNKFSLSHYKLLSLDQGYLVPIGWYEALPGDTIQHSTSALLRASPLVAPVMHPVHARIHHWFVPNRLIWEDWEDFITGGPDGMNDSEFPHFALTGTPATGGLSDYMGIPPVNYSAAPMAVSALPFRAYNLIWNEWYRDQDLCPERVISVASGNDTTSDRTLARVAWEKDRFTSARPWAQKGPEVTLPVGGLATVIGTGAPTFTRDGGSVSGLHTFAGSNVVDWASSSATTSGPTPWADPALAADLSTATAVSINELREAFAIQRYEEARARYGSRYSEYLRYLGVRSSDARLQRPEYLGGGKQTMQFSEVLQTAEGTDPVGDMKGHGIASMRSNRFRRFFEEHGIVMSFLSIKPRTVYAQSVQKGFLRTTKEAYWQQELQHIGQDTIYNQEVYNPHPDPDGIFGYQDRYDEYRRLESSVAGEFRNTLDYWHMARSFAAPPVLNASFVEAVPTDRVYASNTTSEIYCMASHSIQARRAVAKMGTSHIF